MASMIPLPMAAPAPKPTPPAADVASYARQSACKERCQALIRLPSRLGGHRSAISLVVRAGVLAPPAPAQQPAEDQVEEADRPVHTVRILTYRCSHRTGDPVAAGLQAAGWAARANTIEEAVSRLGRRVLETGR